MPRGSRPESRGTKGDALSSAIRRDLRRFPVVHVYAERGERGDQLGRRGLNRARGGHAREHLGQRGRRAEARNAACLEGGRGALRLTRRRISRNVPVPARSGRLRGCFAARVVTDRIVVTDGVVVGRVQDGVSRRGDVRGVLVDSVVAGHLRLEPPRLYRQLHHLAEVRLLVAVIRTPGVGRVQRSQHVRHGGRRARARAPLERARSGSASVP
jgi:hypothetical protein